MQKLRNTTKLYIILYIIKKATQQNRIRLLRGLLSLFRFLLQLYSKTELQDKMRHRFVFLITVNHNLQLHNRRKITWIRRKMRVYPLTDRHALDHNTAEAPILQPQFICFQKIQHYSQIGRRFFSYQPSQFLLEKQTLLRYNKHRRKSAKNGASKGRH